MTTAANLIYCLTFAALFICAAIVLGWAWDRLTARRARRFPTSSYTRRDLRRWYCNEQTRRAAL